MIFLPAVVTYIPVYEGWPESIQPFWIPYFPAHKTHRDISLGILEKNNDECILILVIYWNKTGLLNTKISNRNLIYLS